MTHAHRRYPVSGWMWVHVTPEVHIHPPHRPRLLTIRCGVVLGHFCLIKCLTRVPAHAPLPPSVQCIVCRVPHGLYAELVMSDA